MSYHLCVACVIWVCVWQCGALYAIRQRAHSLHSLIQIPALLVFLLFFFFFNDTATTEIYTLSLHDALPIYWLRWAALAWLVIWFPAYWHTWGAANFLYLCDIAVILTCLGVWTNSALLISSQ